MDNPFLNLFLKKWNGQITHDQLNSELSVLSGSAPSYDITEGKINEIFDVTELIDDEVTDYDAAS